MRTVLVVDDSALVRTVISDVLAGSGEFRVVGTARDGMDAIRKVHALDPDLVTLDILMPDLDGIQTLGYIMSEARRPVVMLSAIDSGSSRDMTIRALELGAVDFVRKPGREAALDSAGLRERLLAALRGAASVNLQAAPMLARPSIASRRAAAGNSAATHVVAIAASTGGPRALAEILPALPPNLGAAVLVVQHMPSGFTESLARRLDRLSALPVAEARHGDVLLAGRIYVAPGGRHMLIDSHDGCARIALDDAPPVWGMRPAADLLFESVAACYASRAVGVVLTGMGRDGAAGLDALRRSGGYAVTQDKVTAAVFGMPMMALRQAGADCVASLGDVAAAISTGLAARGVPIDVTRTLETRS